MDLDLTLPGTATTVECAPNASNWSALAPGRSKCADCATRNHCVIGRLPQAVAGIGPVLRERTFVQGEMLTRQGDHERHFRILKVGMAFLCRDNPDAEARPVAIVARGTPFGSWGYLELPEQLSVVAATAGRYCEIPTEKIQSMARNDKAFRQSLTRTYAEKMATLADWSESTRRRGVAVQVAASLKLLAKAQRTSIITIPSHTALAELLGTSRESVARSLTALEDAGCLVRTSLRRCEIFPQIMRRWIAAHKHNGPSGP